MGVSIPIVTESTVGVSHLCSDVVGHDGVGRALAYPSSQITSLASQDLEEQLATASRCNDFQI